MFARHSLLHRDIRLETLLASLEALGITPLIRPLLTNPNRRRHANRLISMEPLPQLSRRTGGQPRRAPTPHPHARHPRQSTISLRSASPSPVRIRDPSRMPTAPTTDSPQGTDRSIPSNPTPPANNSDHADCIKTPTPGSPIPSSPCPALPRGWTVPPPPRPMFPRHQRSDCCYQCGELDHWQSHCPQHICLHCNTAAPGHPNHTCPDRPRGGPTPRSIQEISADEQQEILGLMHGLRDEVEQQVADVWATRQVVAEIANTIRPPSVGPSSLPLPPMMPLPTTPRPWSMASSCMHASKLLCNHSALRSRPLSFPSTTRSKSTRRTSTTPSTLISMEMVNSERSIRSIDHGQGLLLQTRSVLLSIRYPDHYRPCIECMFNHATHPD